MIASFPSLPIILAIFAVFMVAGTVKGSLGIGLPAVAMSILPIFIEPALGVALVAIPIFVTNFTQFVTVKGWPSVIRRFLLAGVSLAITIFFVSRYVADIPAQWINILVGSSLCVFALSALFKLELNVNEGPVWQLLVGISSGLIGGLSAIKAPIMIYTVALKLPREEFIAAAGFLFFCGGVGLIGGLASAALLNSITLTLSAGAVVMALAGFKIGAIIRGHLSEKVFRMSLLWLILALGIRLIIVNLGSA